MLKLTKNILIIKYIKQYVLLIILAWNEAIQALIQQFVGTGSALTSLFTYAIIVTVIAVIVTVILARFAAKMGIELNE